VAYSIGYPIDVTRAQPDYARCSWCRATWAASHEQRRAVRRMREKRGLNYGDYAYVEYFPRHVPDGAAANLAASADFQCGSGVEPPTAKFACASRC